MKEYHWTITASGFVEADSVEEAKSILKEDAINYVMDDEKYLEIDVDVLASNKDDLSDSEWEKLSSRLDDIETEQAIAWGLNKISGGFVKAEFDEVVNDKIHITITDGVKSDCEDRVNTTHCSLWRKTLQYTD